MTDNCMADMLQKRGCYYFVIYSVICNNEYITMDLYTKYNIHEIIFQILTFMS